MKEKRAALCKGLLMGSLVFCLGFLVMLLLWIILYSSTDLPGLFYYRAATIGDGICLPLLIGSLASFQEYNQQYINKGNKKCLIIACCAAVAGAAIQMSWLLSDDTKLNWSIPIQHYFNAAGWYHSLFFIAIFGVISYQIVELWIVLRAKSDSYTWFEKKLLIVFVTAGSLFILMFAADDYSKELAIPYLFSGIIIVLLIGLAVFIKSAKIKCGNRDLLFAVLIGIISAYGYGLLICHGEGGDIILSIGGALSACFLWRSEKFTLAQMIFMNVWSIPCYFGIIYMASGLTNALQVVFIVLILIMISIWIEKVNIGEIRMRSFAIIAVSAYILANIFTHETVLYDDWLEVVFAIFVYVFFKKEIENAFQVVIMAEESKNKGELKEKEFGLWKAKGYFQIVIGVSSIIILVGRWLIDIALAKGEGLPIGDTNLNKIFICGMIILLVILGVLGEKHLKRYTMSKISVILLVIMLYALLFANAVSMIDMQGVMEWNLIKKCMLLCSVFACIGTSIMVARGYNRNLVTLRGLERKALAVIVAAIQFVGCLLLMGSIAVLVITETNWIRIIVALLSSIIAFVAIPALSARVIEYAYEKTKVVPNKPIGGILQDGFTVMLIVVFAVIMPCTYIGVMERVDAEVVAGAVGLFSTAFVPVGFCLRMNVNHVKRQEMVIEGAQDKESWNQLAKCIECQSWETVFTMLPYILVAVAGKIFSGIIKNMTFKEIKESLMSTYINGWN